MGDFGEAKLPQNPPSIFNFIGLTGENNISTARLALHVDLSVLTTDLM
jgi:hypothetical protein